METTDVPAERTAQEIQGLLVDAGARQVLTEYNEKREITGIHFIMAVENKQIPFKMPVRTEKLFDLFLERAQKKSRLDEAKKAAVRDKAKRVAWRQLLRWIEAQLAFIDSGMAETAEVFYPYLQVSADETLYQRSFRAGLDRLALNPASEQGA